MTILQVQTFGFRSTEQKSIVATKFVVTFHRLNCVASTQVDRIFVRVGGAIFSVGMYILGTEIALEVRGAYRP